MKARSLKTVVKRVGAFCAPSGLLELYRDYRRVAPVRHEVSFQAPRRDIISLFADAGSVQAHVTLAHIPVRPDMLMPLPETIVVGAICQSLRPKRIFEIGTYTGATSLTLALNSPDDAEVFTLDLEPGIDPSTKEAIVGSAFRRTPSERKIRQLFGNSTQFDFGPYLGTMDLVLVDANHGYEFVKADTANALRLIKKGGVILWDDYLWDPSHPECSGVTRCVDELLADYRINLIEGTRLAIYIS